MLPCCRAVPEVENMKTSVAVSANFVDESNLERALEEAEILGIVEETPELLAASLRRAATKAEEAEESLESETLRGFKARHGELRAPREVQNLLKRGFALSVLALLSASLTWACLRAKQKEAKEGKGKTERERRVEPVGPGQEMLAEGLLMVDRASKARGEVLSCCLFSGSEAKRRSRRVLADPVAGTPRQTEIESFNSRVQRQVAVQKQLGDLLPGGAKSRGHTALGLVYSWS